MRLPRTLSPQALAGAAARNAANAKAALVINARFMFALPVALSAVPHRARSRIELRRRGRVKWRAASIVGALAPGRAGGFNAA